LDYYRNLSSPETQRHVFIRQVKLAVELKKPLVLHCRYAHDDVLSVLRDWVPLNHKVHWHCFTGFGPGTEPLEKNTPQELDWKLLEKRTLELMEEIEARESLFVGITGRTTRSWCAKELITIQNLAQIKNPLQVIPLSRMLLESDGPYCSPFPNKKIATSDVINFLARGLARLRNVDTETVLQDILVNTNKMYGID
jgi:TatD DNase family protein